MSYKFDLMAIENLVAEIIKSPSAQKILNNTVTEGFYNRSRIALWMFEVIGKEWDDIEKYINELPLERFPQTATWSIPIWEFVYGIEADSHLSLDQRRARILTRRFDHPPINPARIERALSATTGLPVDIEEHVAPYTFKVTIDESENMIFDHREALRILRRMKPSHLSFRYESRAYSEVDFGLYITTAPEETISEFFFSDNLPTENTIPLYITIAPEETISEFFFFDNLPAETAAQYYITATPEESVAEYLYAS